MFSTYFKTAIRYFSRNKLYTVINIAGLAVGAASCLVIFSIVQFENSFDKQWDGGERIHRVYSKYSGIYDMVNNGVSTGMAGWVQENVTGLESSTHFHTWHAQVSVQKDDGEIVEWESEWGAIVCSPSFFDVFPDYTWVSGTPSAALGQPGQVVLTADRARQYFGVKDANMALGQELTYEDSLILTVTGIVEPPSFHTDIQFESFISYATIESTWLKDQYSPGEWGSTSSNSQLFVKIRGDSELNAIQGQLEKGAELRESMFPEDKGTTVAFLLQPFSDLHFSHELSIFDSRQNPAHRPTLLLMSLVAVLLLVMAAVNFINLETAQSLKRSREVGVRKVLGGTRGQLITQFMSSTFVLTVTAMVLALGLAYGAVAYFKDFIPDGMSIDLTEPGTWAIIAGITLGICLIAGAYPAFVLSSFKPVRALKSQLAASDARGGGIRLRQGLVVFQFAIAQLLIFGTLTVGQQIRYMLNKDLGFDKEAIVYFYTPWRDRTDGGQVLMNEIRRMPEVSTVSSHGGPPASRGYSTSVMTFVKDGEELTHSVHQKSGDSLFVKLYGIDLIAGRNLIPNDSIREYLINETYVQQLGFEDPFEVIGQNVGRSGSRDRIVGVVSDFHLQSLHNEIQPMAISNRSGRCIGMKIQVGEGSPGQLSRTIEKIKARYQQLFPDREFNHYFLDEAVANFYAKEKDIASLVNTATGLAIFICCLGLIGLISFTTIQRLKEIGIRKVMGASVSQIMAMLSRSFLLLVLLGMTIATPFAWWLGSQWLKDYPYRIDLQWWQFALVGLIGIGIAVLTVSYHSFRAAMSNPADVLRTE